MARYLVTGATGFIGRHLVELLDMFEQATGLDDPYFRTKHASG